MLGVLAVGRTDWLSIVKRWLAGHTRGSVTTAGIDVWQRECVPFTATRTSTWPTNSRTSLCGPKIWSINNDVCVGKKCASSEVFIMFLVNCSYRKLLVCEAAWTPCFMSKECQRIATNFSNNNKLLPMFCLCLSSLERNVKSCQGESRIAVARAIRLNYSPKNTPSSYNLIILSSNWDIIRIRK